MLLIQGKRVPTLPTGAVFTKINNKHYNPNKKYPDDPFLLGLYVKHDSEVVELLNDETNEPDEYSNDLTLMRFPHDGNLKTEELCSGEDINPNDWFFAFTVSDLKNFIKYLQWANGGCVDEKSNKESDNSDSEAEE